MIVAGGSRFPKYDSFRRSMAEEHGMIRIDRSIWIRSIARCGAHRQKLVNRTHLVHSKPSISLANLRPVARLVTIRVRRGISAALPCHSGE
jgi:hypothetical protein